MQRSSLKYNYSKILLKQVLFQQQLGNNTLTLFFFLPSYDDKKILETLSLKTKGKLWDFSRSTLLSLSQDLKVIDSEKSKVLQGIASHRCYCLVLPLTFLNLSILEDFLVQKKALTTTFILYNGIFLPSILQTLFLLKNLPFISNILIVLYFAMKLTFLRVVSRFILLNLKRLS